jgi:dolichol-phosphate mannosyltransferase
MTQPTDLSSPPPAIPALDVSVIIPTINEAANLPELLRRIDAALGDIDYEVIVVDDNSKDDTPAVCAELAKTYPLTLLVRTTPRNGLSGAVLHGMEQAHGEYFCVMDADLQHPPEKLPELLAPLRAGEADFVIGSRYMPGGSTENEWGFFRKFNSRVATLLARPFAGRTTDPMAGFFALKRETYLSARQLTPLGYKIALELMCKCGAKNVREIPIHFALRLAGESKLSLKQQFRYLEHLSRLYDFTFPRVSPILKFVIATVAGWLVGLAAYLCSGAGHVMAIVLAYPATILVTAIFHARYIRTQREFIIRRHPWMDFTVISLAEWIVCGTAAWWVVQRVREPGPLEIFIFAYGCATITRYILRKEFLQDIRGLRKALPREAEVSRPHNDLK